MVGTSLLVWSDGTSKEDKFYGHRLDLFDVTIRGQIINSGDSDSRICE